MDADFARLWRFKEDQDPVCVKSRIGYVLTFGNCLVLWVSKLQTEIALSTLEAEYIALSQTMRNLLPMRSLLEEIGTKLKMDFANPTIMHSTVFEDNNGALGLATSPRVTPRTKHIAVKMHFFKSYLRSSPCGTGSEPNPTMPPLRIQRIDSAEQKADIFTKGLTEATFISIRKLLMGW